MHVAPLNLVFTRISTNLNGATESLAPLKWCYQCQKYVTPFTILLFVAAFGSTICSTNLLVLLEIVSVRDRVHVHVHVRVRVYFRVRWGVRFRVRVRVLVLVRVCEYARVRVCACPFLRPETRYFSLCAWLHSW